MKGRQLFSKITEIPVHKHTIYLEKENGFVALNTFLYRLILTVVFIEYDYIFYLKRFFYSVSFGIEKNCVHRKYYVKI